MTDFSFLPDEKRLNDSSLQQVICIGFAVIFKKHLAIDGVQEVSLK